MSLDDPALPLPCDRRPDLGAHFRFRHPAVQDVNPQFLTPVYDRLHLSRIVTFQPFSAQPDFTDGKSCFP